MTDMEALQRRLGDTSLDGLEARRDALLEELGGLARLSMNSGVGRIGYRSAPHGHASSEEWVQIDFAERVAVEEIVLVPVIWRDAELGFVADGFPEAFVVEIGDGADDSGTVVARHGHAGGILPRTAPFVIDGGGRRASWVRITASQLSPRHFDGQFSLQFSEVLVFSALQNVALHRPVRCSSASVAGSGAWHPDFLVDGMTPYLMDAAGGGGSLAFANEAGFSDPPSFVIDLGEVFTVDTLILHVIEQTDTVPQAFPGDYGVPFRFILEGSETPEFSHPVRLHEFARETIFAVSPILMLQLERRPCRYVRLTALEPYIFEGMDDNEAPIADRRLGFAEIEIISGGRNVALGCPVKSNFHPGQTVRRIETLTDGRNLYGEILPIKDWLMQLAKRHDREFELPMVNRELGRRYDAQKANLYWLKLSLGMMGMAAIITVLVIRILQQRLIYRTRERITADLHDVLGGNISAIGLLGQVAQNDIHNPEQLSGYLRRIENLAGRTRNALKYISDMLNEPGIYKNLLQEMRRIGNGLTEGIEHSFDHRGEEFIPRLSERRRVDVFLFYKECLVNIIRHARATRIRTVLILDRELLQLNVSDNGVGLPGGPVPSVPASLRRRARLLGATVSATREAAGGSGIELCLELNRHWTGELYTRLSVNLIELYEWILKKR